MEDETSDIINQMFALDLDEILQKVFLFLDPVSLKDARCVSRQWNQFIKNRLWGSRVAREKLMSGLKFRWGNESNVNEKCLAKCKREVRSLDCDEKFFYCGTLGFVEVYCLSTGQIIHELDCNADIGRCDLKFDVGEAEIAVVTGAMTIWVWDKIKGEVLYKAIHHLSSPAFGIKVISRGVVLSEDGNGNLALIRENEDNEWSLVNKFTDLRGERVFHIDSDGDWLVTGTKSAVYLWSFTNNSLVLVPGSIKVEDSSMLTFSFPFIFVVGGGDWAGLQVWNIDSREMIRHIDLDGREFYDIKSNGRLRFLTITGAMSDWFVFTFDKKELSDSEVSDDKLWQNFRTYEPINGQVFTAINTTSLVVNINDSITVQNYWDCSKELIDHKDRKENAIMTFFKKLVKT